MKASTLRQLRMVDWDFISRPLGIAPSLHWYPGTFPAALPGTLIEILSDPGATVVDPYAGVGTTGTEALRLGRSALLAEYNPLARLVCAVSGGLMLLARTDQGRLRLLFDALRDFSVAVLGAAGDSSRHLISSWQYLPEHILPREWEMDLLGSVSELVAGSPRRTELRRWVEGETLSEIIRLIRKAKSDLPPFAAACMLVAVSDRLRSLSSQTRSWGHIADSVEPETFERKSVLSAVGRWISVVESALKSTRFTRSPHEPSLTVRGVDWTRRDARLAPSEPASLLVTSPPYGGALDYLRSQRLSAYLLGYSSDELSVLASHEIGARRKRFSKTSQTDWIHEISSALQGQLDALSNDAVAVFVLPSDDSDRGKSAAAFYRVLEHLGWQKQFAVDRSIRGLRARHTWTSIRRETVSVYSR